VKDCFQSDPPAELSPGWGDRLARERLGLELTRADLAELLGVHMPLVHAWESEAFAPPVSYLAEFFQMGMDAVYIVTGQPSPLLPGVLPPEERYLLYLFRGLDEDGKAAVLAESARQRERAE